MKDSYGKLARFASFMAACATAACGAEVSAPTESTLGTDSEEIINGLNVASNGNLVALYHLTTGECQPDAADAARGFTLPYTLFNKWWPRPCSGTVIKKDGTTNYILTARHCVTADGEPDGIPFSSDSMRSTSALNPGVVTTVESNGSMSVTGSPPASAVNTSVFYSSYPMFGDIAIVKAIGNLQPTVAGIRPGLMGFTPLQASNFLSTQLQTQGYGRNLSGYCYSHAISGSGRLRYAQPFGVTSVGTTTFAHVETNSNGQKAWGGDSGGPLYTTLNVNGTQVMKIFGVHKYPSTATGGQNLVDFIQAAFGHVYLTEQTALPASTVVAADSVANGALVRTGVLNDGATRRMTVDRANGYLKIGTLCLSDEFSTTGSAQIRLRSCGTNGTRWDIYPGGAIRGRGTTRCMKSNGSGVIATEPCTAFPTLWTFVADVIFS